MSRKAIFAGMIILLLGTASMVHAIPLVYTFEGTVTNASFDEVSWNNHNRPPMNRILSTGDIVYHKVLIDYDSDYVPDLAGPFNPTVHQFSAEYLGGTAMITPYINNHGYNVSNPRGEHVAGSIFCGPMGSGIGDSQFTIWSEDIIVYEWAIGTSLSAEAHFSSYGFVFEDLTFTSISNPVPEPGTILLIGTGIVGFAGPRFRRMLKRKPLDKINE